jgi:hypothetical protein
MSASLASLAYLHGLEAIIIICVTLLLGCMAFAVVLAYILKSFLHRGSETTTPESDGRSGRVDE